MKNERNEYAEPIVKNMQVREEYYQGIHAYLEEQRTILEKEREIEFCPKSYWQNSEEFRQKFIEMLGYPLIEKREIPKLLEKTFVATDKNVDIYRIRLQFFNKLPFYGLYFQQTKNTNSAPFVICLHGKEGTPEMISGMHMNSANYNHLVRRITARGVNVFVPQLLLWSIPQYGNEYNRLETDGKLRQLGGSMTALELYLLRGAIDYFIQNEEIEERKIGVAGLSYGGMYALHLAAIDTRIKACYSCSWVCNGYDYSFADWSYFNAQKSFSTVETAALVCPRALVIAMGDKDQLFEWQKTVKTSQRVEAFYKYFKKESNYKLCVFHGEHEADKDDKEIEFLIRNLECN